MQGSGRPTGGASYGRPAGGAEPGKPIGGAGPGKPIGGAGPGKPIGGAFPDRPVGGAGQGKSVKGNVSASKSTRSNTYRGAPGPPLCWNCNKRTQAQCWAKGGVSR